MAPHYELVLFDFDGTLADTFPWFAGVLNDVADRYRFNRVQGEEAELLRGCEPRVILQRLGIAPWKLLFVARHLRRALARDVHQISLFSGVPELLAGLRSSGSLLAIVSSNSEGNVRAILGPENAGRFTLYACGSSLFGKAAKIRRILARSAVAPDRSILVGDEIRDAQAARACGIAFGAVSWGYNTPEALQLCCPQELFRTPGELLEKLRRSSPL